MKKRKRNYSIVNNESSIECKMKHKENINEWNIYAQKIQKHPYVRSLLYEKYNGICQFCGDRLKSNFVIHHASYDCICEKSTEIIEIQKPTEKRPNRKIKVPNCEGCNNLDKCTKNLYPVCKICNLIIDNIAKKRSEAFLTSQKSQRSQQEFTNT